jgi:hypothetical protein
LKQKFTINGYVEGSSENSMKNAVLINPLYASITVIDSFYNYKNGIYNGCSSSDTSLNHAGI